MSLPMQAEEIGCVWITDEGGFHITAKTDSVGHSVIGVATFDRRRKTPSPATEYLHDHVLHRLVVGYDGCGKAIAVYAKIEVTERGLEVRVLVPPVLKARRVNHYLFAPWIVEKNRHDEDEEEIITCIH